MHRRNLEGTEVEILQTSSPPPEPAKCAVVQRISLTPMLGAFCSKCKCDMTAERPRANQDRTFVLGQTTSGTVRLRQGPENSVVWLRPSPMSWLVFKCSAIWSVNGSCGRSWPVLQHSDLEAPGNVRLTAPPPFRL